MRKPICHPDAKHQARGLCTACYMRAYDHNQLTNKRPRRRAGEPLIDYIARRTIEQSNGCLDWNGCERYPAVWDGTRNRQVTHVVLEHKLGRPLRDGMEACHTCDRPSCVSAEHLWEGTPSQNSRDMASKGRASMAGAKLTTDDVRYIKAAHVPHSRTYSARKLARQFGVQPQAVYDILRGHKWRHVV